MMERRIEDRNLLNSFAADFVKELEELGIKYIIVSGFVAISHGRVRGTEDIDLIIERIPEEIFAKLHEKLDKAGFECLQGSDSKDLFSDYLAEKLSLRYVRKGSFVPEMELKFAKDALDDLQLENRLKLPLTGLPFYFSSIEANIAFKEELLKSEKDLEDSRHLRVIYAGKLDEKEIKKIKQLIRKYRL
jgi:hypothetical protein